MSQVPCQASAGTPSSSPPSPASLEESGDTPSSAGGGSHALAKDARMTRENEAMVRRTSPRLSLALARGFAPRENDDDGPELRHHRALPRGMGSVRIAPHHRRQVFGLTGVSLALARSGPSFGHRFPGRVPQCDLVTVVPAHRCGAVPDSHRVPSCRARPRGGLRTVSTSCVRGAGDAVNGPPTCSSPRACAVQTRSPPCADPPLSAGDATPTRWDHHPGGAARVCVVRSKPLGLVESTFRPRPR